MMQRLRLAFDCDAALVEPLTELLERLGAESVSVSGAAQETLLVEATEARGWWAANRVAALLPAGADLDIILACLRNRAGAAGLRNPEIGPLADRDWLAAGREGYGPLHFGDRLCICPSWIPAPAGKQVLTLDPGLAFGTGTHVTTALCLEWLAASALEGREVIDFGCGSGVLGLAAAALGAGRVRAVDVDPQAVTATAENARRNGLAGVVVTGHPDAIDTAACDVLLANILLGPLLELAPRFAALIRPGGEIVLSGVLAHQADGCLGRYQRWFTMAAPRYRAEWALLTGRRCGEG